MAIVIAGIGTSLPENALTNEDVVQRIRSVGGDYDGKTSTDWIREMTGISTRYHITGEETSLALALNASVRALKHANVAPCEIDRIVVGTVEPSIGSHASLIHEALHVETMIPACDVNAGCSGFLYALQIAYALMCASPTETTSLVVGMDVLSKMIDWTDRGIAPLLGDGAGAIVLKKTTDRADVGIRKIITSGRGIQEPLFADCVRLRETRDVELYPWLNNPRYLHMQGKEVFKIAVDAGTAMIERILMECNIALQDVDFIVPHQANERINTAIMARLIKRHKNTPTIMCSNIASVGNTSSASIPLCLADYVERGAIKNGNKIILVAFGAGFTFGATYLEWYV